MRVVGALAAAAVLALGLAGAHRSRLLTIERRTSSDAAVVGAVASGVAVDIERALDAVASAAQLVPLSSPAIAVGPRVLGSIPGAQALGYEALDGGAASGAEGSPLAGLDRADPPLAALLDRARDTGAAALSAPVEQDGAARTLVVAAVYAPQPGGPPGSTSARRDGLLGWVVASVDLESLAGRHLPEGAVAAVWDGQDVPEAGARLPGRLPHQRIDVDGRVLTVAAGTRSDIGHTAPTIAFAAGRHHRRGHRVGGGAPGGSPVADRSAQTWSATPTRCASSATWPRWCSSRSSWAKCFPRWRCSSPITSGWRACACSPARAAPVSSSCSAWGSGRRRPPKPVLQPARPPRRW